MSHQPKKPIEQVVSELNRHPIDAFAFVQECIGTASDQVHGPMTPEEASVARWMAAEEVNLDELRERHVEGALPPEIESALDKLGGPDSINRHVTGQELCWAVRDVALNRWGLMARGVLARWNITRTGDIGAIIFALVDNDWLQKQPTDSIDDFDNVFDFDEAFDQRYRIDQG